MGNIEFVGIINDFFNKETSIDNICEKLNLEIKYDYPSQKIYITMK